MKSWIHESITWFLNSWIFMYLDNCSTNVTFIFHHLIFMYLDNCSTNVTFIFIYLIFMYFDNFIANIWKNTSYCITRFSCTLIIAVQRHESMKACFHAFMPLCPQVPGIEIDQSFKIPQGVKTYIILLSY